MCKARYQLPSTAYLLYIPSEVGTYYYSPFRDADAESQMLSHSVGRAGIQSQGHFTSMLKMTTLLEPYSIHRLELAQDR